MPGDLGGRAAIKRALVIMAAVLVFCGLLIWRIAGNTGMRPLTIDGVTFISPYRIELDPQGYAGYFRPSAGIRGSDRNAIPLSPVNIPREVMTSEVLPFDLEGFEFEAAWGIAGGDYMLEVKWKRGEWDGIGDIVPKDFALVNISLGRDSFATLFFGNSVTTLRGETQVYGIGGESQNPTLPSQYQFTMNIGGQDCKIYASGVSAEVAGAIMEYILKYPIKTDRLMESTR